MLEEKKSTHSALISVSDKTGLIELAKGLTELKFRLLSTGGTARHLRNNGIHVIDVEDITGSPEIMDGRVKTLNPKIHAAILADRSNPGHQADLRNLGVEAIDLVIVNLYDFKRQAAEKHLNIREAIEFIDIGGPAMLRAAAKNHEHCLPVIDPCDYPEVLKRLLENRIDQPYRKAMAVKVFQKTFAYDRNIAEYLETIALLPSSQNTSGDAKATLRLDLPLKHPLRYGENPHQTAILYSNDNSTSGIPNAQVIQGKELSYNNYLDLDAAAALVADLFPTPAITIIKHTNPCGTAASTSLDTKSLFLKALASDPKCAFGGIVASNVPIDQPAALAMVEIFTECIIAPDYSVDALEVFRQKKNLRVLKSSCVAERPSVASNSLRLHSILGGVLAQSSDIGLEPPSNWTCVTKNQPTPELISEMAFAMTVCKHVKSNAIVLTSDFRTIGVGAGQMSRIDSVYTALTKARALGHSLDGAVLASDAFFPFRDCIDEIVKSGIRSIVQPGGSIRDQESIEAANEHRMVMMFTGRRHFKH